MCRRSDGVVLLGAGLLAVLALGGCAGSDFSGETGMVDARDVPPPGERPEAREIEESDIYRLDGDWLYVLNGETGLNILDVSEPSAPRLAGRMAVGGNPGELYVRGSAAYMIFDELARPCTLGEAFDVGRSQGWSELVSIDGAPSEPAEVARLCMPGLVLASRIVGDVLYVVANEEQAGNWEESWQTWLFSFDVSDPRGVSLLDFMALEGRCREVHVTPTAIYLAQPTDRDPVFGRSGTQIRYVDIADPGGAMTARGQVAVSGEPRGRFHMDEEGSTFRIVTFDQAAWATDLHVVDVSQADSLRVLSSLQGIAPGEELHATYFEGERVYIVTFLPPPPNFEFGWDPLWIVSLEDPTEPEVLGELELPGWSDFVFPIGERLIGVGRGERGDNVGVALFDISEPHAPALLRRLEFGSPGASSEANLDFRGVRIVEPGRLAPRGLLVVPFDDLFVTFHGCEEPGHFLQILEIEPTDLTPTAAVELRAPGRRALPVGDQLYVIDDVEVTALDVSEATSPIALDTVVVGLEAVSGQCLTFGGIEAGCNASGAGLEGGRANLGAAILFALAFVALGLRRRGGAS